MAKLYQSLESWGVRIDPIPPVLQPTYGGAEWVVSITYSEDNPSHYTLLATFKYLSDATEYYEARWRKVRDATIGIEAEAV